MGAAVRRADADAGVAFGRADADAGVAFGRAGPGPPRGGYLNSEHQEDA